MKIKTKTASYQEVMALPRWEHKPPRKPGILFRTLMRLLGIADLRSAHFSYTVSGELPSGPCLILMNHSSFIDLEIVSRIFYPKPYCIVCTSDGFVGKEWLMRRLGCIPTQKFVSDVSLIRDMDYALHTLGCSVLMYPEASYSFDGTATPLPRKMGILLKKLDVPVISIHTSGAFSRDPLYNCLQKRDVPVSAEVTCLLTREEIAEKSVRELDAILDDAFAFDNFAWQRDNRVGIDAPFRADGLNRILYRCPACGAEGKMEGKGVGLTCHACGKHWELDRFGQLAAPDGETEFSHIPDWYAWERGEVRKALADGSYSLDIPVKIGMMVDFKAIYMVGEGRLRHGTGGFVLEGCDGALHYEQPPLSNYGLYADYYWYELGDIICIGGRDALYYCFPQGGDVVAKTRIAAEELYKLKKSRPRPVPNAD